MKIAAAYDKNSGLINNDFETAGHFKIYEIENGEISYSEILSTMKGDIDMVVGMLCMFEVDAVFCNNIKETTMENLSSEGIHFYKGQSGNPDSAVNSFLDGKPLL